MTDARGRGPAPAPSLNPNGRRRKPAEAEPALGGSLNARPRTVISTGTWGTSQAAGAVQGSDNNYVNCARPIYVEQLPPCARGNRQQRRLYEALVKASRRRGAQS